MRWLIALIGAGLGLGLLAYARRANAAPAPSNAAAPVSTGDDASLGTLPNVLGLLTREAKEPGFARALLKAYRELGFTPEQADHLTSLLAEEGGFDPQARNSIKATGLMGWHPTWAKQISGYDVDELYGMTAIQQIDALKNTIKHDPLYRTDPAMAGWGSHAGAPDDTVIATKDDPATPEDEDKTKSYALNKGYDAEGKGYITSGDVRKRVYLPLRMAQGKPRIGPDGKSVS